MRPSVILPLRPKKLTMPNETVLLPQPDSPTIPNVFGAVNLERDIAHGGHVAVAGFVGDSQLNRLLRLVLPWLA